ncbi:MAG: site-specific integrase [Steroidobacteraceae bacterium]
MTTRRRPKTDPNALVPRTTVLARDPDTLHAQAEASVRALLQEGESANTQRSYAAALRYWAAWFRLRYRQPLILPVPVPAVLQFLVDHLQRSGDAGALLHDLPAPIDEALVEGGFKGQLGAPALNTVLHRLSVLSKAHAMKNSVSPTRAPAVQELLKRARRAYAARGPIAIAKPALTKEPLDAMLATCTDGLVGVRDRALLLFAFASGGRRRSEVAAASLENLTTLGDGAYLYRLTHSKTDQAGTDHNPNAVKPIMGPAAEALAAWLQAAGITSGRMFRRIRATRVAEPLFPQAVWLIVKRRTKLAGLGEEFSAHSLRSGFVTEAGRQNVPMGEAMAMTGHRSTTTFLRYFQAGSIRNSRAVQMLDFSGNELLKR